VAHPADWMRLRVTQTRQWCVVQVVQAPTPEQGRQFSALLDRVSEAMEFREGKLAAAGSSQA
jgi:hypothetical protein